MMCLIIVILLGLLLLDETKTDNRYTDCSDKSSSFICRRDIVFQPVKLGLEPRAETLVALGSTKGHLSEVEGPFNVVSIAWQVYH